MDKEGLISAPSAQARGLVTELAYKRQALDNKDVKAVVLRVNSPGGSAEASEVVLDQLRQFKADRPVIVSMGTVAASGGYWISMAARRIIAEPSTITGSLGVFGLGLNVKKLANDHGITFDTIQTGALAELGGLQQAIAAAAKEAKLGASYSVIEFPDRKGLLESLSEAFAGEKGPLTKQDLASRVTQKVKAEWRWLSSFNDQHGIYTRLPLEHELN